MAAVAHASGVKLVFKLGDGADPEVFTALCTINAERGVQFQGNEQTFEIVDCADPEAIAWLSSEMTSLRVSFNGGGMLNTPDADTFYDWWESGESENGKVIIDVPGASGGIVLTGAWKLPSWEITGGRGAKMTASLSIVSDGEITKTANA